MLQPTNAAELDAVARRLLDEADKNLVLVASKPLTGGAREQYDNAMRFVRQAREALSAKNYLYATQLATNANTLARLLIKR